MYVYCCPTMFTPAFEEMVIDNFLLLRNIDLNEIAKRAIFIQHFWSAYIHACSGVNLAEKCCRSSYVRRHLKVHF